MQQVAPQTDHRDDAVAPPSIARLRTRVSGRPRLSFLVVVALGLGNLVSFLAAASQRDLPTAILRLAVGLMLGGLALLILNELVGHEIEWRTEEQGERSFWPLRALYWCLTTHRWETFCVLIAMIAVGLASVQVSGLRFLQRTVAGQSFGALLAVTGLTLITAWVLAWLVDLERGVLVCPECWLATGLALAVIGGLLWSLTTASWSVVGAILGIAGLIATKMAISPMIDRVTWRNGRLPASGVMTSDRRLRAFDIVAFGLVTAVAGALVMAVGAAEERASFLTLGLLTAVVGLSLVGASATRLTFSAAENGRLSPNERMVSAVLVAGGVLAVVWGSVRVVEAAGDWLPLIVVICVVLASLGGWFVFRGEGLVFLALVTFLIAWSMQDRATQSLDEINQGEVTAEGSILAIGDSFMSGEGASDFFRGTNSPAANTCRRANTSFAALLAEDLDRDLHFFACSGAVTANVTRIGTPQMPASPPTLAGAGTQLGNLSDPNLISPAAVDGIGVVLVSIGGNDTGFSDIIQACLLPTDCAEEKEQWIAKAESLEPRLVETYRDIDGATGEAPVLIIPYPTYIKPMACDRVASGPEFEFVVEFIAALNNTILRAAREADVLVANTSQVFAGRTQCDERPAANLVILAPPAGSNLLARLNPAQWVHGTMHPFAAGHRLQADRLKPLVSRLLTGCGAGVSCRIECVAGQAGTGIAGLMSQLRLDATLLADTCAAPEPVTPEADQSRLEAEADLLLAAGVNRQLFGAAGVLVWPFIALVAGGLLTALGLIRRPGPAGSIARFLAPNPTPSPVVNNDSRIHVVGLASEQQSACLLAVVAKSETEDPPKPFIVWVKRVDGSETTQVAFDSWRYFAGGRHPFYWAKQRVDGLEPATIYHVVDRAEGPIAAALARIVTLPDAGQKVVSVVAGSCYYRNDKGAESLKEAYDDLVGEDEPILHFWLGDQVYVDHPWRDGLRSTDISDQVAKRYLDSWEIGTNQSHDPGDGRRPPRDHQARLGYVLRRSSNRFLPDDHEFWNGYPKISYRTLPRHAIARRLNASRDRLSPGSAPTSGHPARQGPFGKIAGLAYLIFQSTEDLEGPLTDADSPEPIQIIPIGAGSNDSQARIVMVDTRWSRTVKAGSSGSAGFMDPTRLCDLERELAKPGLVVLMLSRPLAGFPPVARRWWWREQLTEHYKSQYDRLCSAVANRANADPTVVMAGDIHQYSLYTVGGGKLLQVVSSPIVLRGRPHPSHEPYVFLDEAPTGSTGRQWKSAWSDEADMTAELPMTDEGYGGLVRLDIKLDEPSSPEIGYRYMSLGHDQSTHTLRWSAVDKKWSDRSGNPPVADEAPGTNPGAPNLERSEAP